MAGRPRKVAAPKAEVEAAVEVTAAPAEVVESVEIPAEARAEVPKPVEAEPVAPRVLAATVILPGEGAEGVVILRAGDVLPEQYADRVTNPAAFEAVEAE